MCQNISILNGCKYFRTHKQPLTSYGPFLGDLLWPLHSPPSLVSPAHGEKLVLPHEDGKRFSVGQETNYKEDLAVWLKIPFINISREKNGSENEHQVFPLNSCLRRLEVVEAASLANCFFDLFVQYISLFLY